MDPPSDPRLEERICLLDDASRDLVESSPPSASEIHASSFVRRAAAPRVQIMLAASRMKALVLSEKGLTGQFTGI